MAPPLQASVTAVLKRPVEHLRGTASACYSQPLPCLHPFPTEAPPASAAEENILSLCTSELSGF